MLVVLHLWYNPEMSFTWQTLRLAMTCSINSGYLVLKKNLQAFEQLIWSRISQPGFLEGHNLSSICRLAKSPVLYRPLCTGRAFDFCSHCTFPRDIVMLPYSENCTFLNAEMFNLLIACSGILHAMHHSTIWLVRHFV